MYDMAKSMILEIIGIQWWTIVTVISSPQKTQTQSRNNSFIPSFEKPSMDLNKNMAPKDKITLLKYM